MSQALMVRVHPSGRRMVEPESANAGWRALLHAGVRVARETGPLITR